MSERLPRTFEFIDQGISQGLQLGAQIYVSLHGELIADGAVGESRQGVPMRPDTINPWMSSGKPITALAIVQLWEQGKLGLDDRVSQWIPEFSVKGKEPITIRQILTHMGGFRAVIGLDWNDAWDVAVAKVCNAALEPRWVLGKSAGYHASSSWYILGELVRRIDGRSIDQYVQEAIFGPLGMTDCWIGLPMEQYEAYGESIGFLHDAREGQFRPNMPGSTPEDASAVRPSSNVRGPIRELGRFYEMFLHGGHEGLLSRPAAEAMSARHRAGVMDSTFKYVIDMGLGVIVNSVHYGGGVMPYGYGPHAGLRAFGHSGQLSSCAFCDPDARLVVAWVCNGMPTEPESHQRQDELNRAIYEDLALGAVSG